MINKKKNNYTPLFDFDLKSDWEDFKLDVKVFILIVFCLAYITIPFWGPKLFIAFR